MKRIQITIKKRRHLSEEQNYFLFDYIMNEYPIDLYEESLIESTSDRFIEKIVFYGNDECALKGMLESKKEQIKEEYEFLVKEISDSQWEGISTAMEFGDTDYLSHVLSEKKT